MSQEIIKLKVERTGQQRKAWDALDDPTVRRIMYGGAKGGGKSWFLCVWLFTMVYAIMDEAKLQPSANPPHVAWFGRKQATDLTGTTLQTWREVIPEEYYTLRGGTEKDPKHILIADRIAIDYGGLDKQENINKFNSAEYIIIAIDQAEEVSKDDVSVLRGSLRMVLKEPKTGKPIKFPFKELYTANPRQCWLKQDFITDRKDNARFIPALPTDNPHLPDDYIETLEEAFGHRPELLRAYKDGDWSAIEGAEQVIKDSWIEEAKLRTCHAPRVKRYLVCDTARFGDDETVIYFMENCEILGKKILGHTRTTDISNRLAALASQGKIVYKMDKEPQIVVESIGADLGAGVIDELVALGKDVIQFNPAGKSEYLNEQGKPIYGNLRAEAWSKVAKILSSGMLDEETNTVVECKNMYQELRNQLCIPQYKFAGTKIMIEKKSEIKKRMNRSPDHADTYIIGLWAWDMIDYANDPDDKIGYRDSVKKDKQMSPMRMC